MSDNIIEDEIDKILGPSQKGGRPATSTSTQGHGTKVPVSSGFGQRVHPITGKITPHKGVDITGRLRSPIYAVYDGIVVVAKKSSSAGLMVIIDHGNKLKTTYMHMSKITVRVNQKVLKGAQIGEMGNTGHSTGVHLHLEVAENGVARPATPTEQRTAVGIGNV